MGAAAMAKGDGRLRVLADMASLGMTGEMRKVRRYRRVAEAAPDAELSASNKREVKGGKGRKAGKRKAADDPSAKAVSEHVRNKPTPERIARGAFERVDLARFDPARAGDRALLDWRARAGGVGEMYLRGQITRRMADAAATLMDKFELSQTSGLSCSQVKERVDGGMVDLSGGRLTAASSAWGEYQDALAKLSRWGRILVEKRVVEGRAMEEVAMLPALADAVGDCRAKDRAKRAFAMLRDALDHLADGFGLPPC